MQSQHTFKLISYDIYETFFKVVPDIKTQEMNEKNPYAGIFHFTFWR